MSDDDGGEDLVFVSKEALASAVEALTGGSGTPQVSRQTDGVQEALNRILNVVADGFAHVGEQIAVCAGHVTVLEEDMRRAILVVLDPELTRALGPVSGSAPIVTIAPGRCKRFMRDMFIRDSTRVSKAACVLVARHLEDLTHVLLANALKAIRHSDRKRLAGGDLVAGNWPLSRTMRHVNGATWLTEDSLKAIKARLIAKGE